MALVNKSAVFQVRVEPALLDEFRHLVESRGYTVSGAIRRYMLGVLDSAGKKYVPTVDVAADALAPIPQPGLLSDSYGDDDPDEVTFVPVGRAERRKAGRDSRRYDNAAKKGR